MCIVPDSLDALRNKGVESHILQRDLGGYWDKVYTIHPFCKRDEVFELSDKHTVLEYKAFSPHILPSLIRLIKTERITVIKAHDPHFTGPLAWLLSRKCRIPYVVMICSSYDLMEKQYGRPQLRLKFIDKLVSKFVLSRADMVYGGARNAMDWAVRNGADPDRATVVRTGGVDEWHFTDPKERESPRDKYGLNRRRVMLYVGRLDDIKFPQDAVKCAGIVRKVFKDAMLVVVGNGPLKATLTAQSGNNTLFLDFVRCQRRLADIMAMADVVLAPLSGSALVECALAARPIVAYDVDWHGELIVDGETGILVPFRDYEAMAQKTIDILNDGKLARRLGGNARKVALKQHSLESLYRQEAACFDRVLGAYNG